MSEHSPQDLRVILKRLRSGDAKKSGPLASGLRESDRIVVASFHNPYVRQRFCRALWAAGIGWVTRKEGRKVAVEVSYGDRDVAWQVLAEQQAEDPDSRPRTTRGPNDFTILGGAAGAVLGVASLALSPLLFLRIVAWIGFLGSGLLVGRIADRFQRRYRYLGHVQFTTGDCLLLTVAAALIVSFWTFLLRLL